MTNTGKRTTLILHRFITDALEGLVVGHINSILLITEKAIYASFPNTKMIKIVMPNQIVKVGSKGLVITSTLNVGKLN